MVISTTFLSFYRGFCRICIFLILYVVFFKLFKRFIAHTLGFSTLFTQTFFLIGFIFLVVTVKKGPLLIAFASQDMGGNAVKEPAVMTDDHDAASKFQQSIF